MKTLLCFLVLCACVLFASAQERRLFLVDDYNGNYREFDQGVEITLILKGDSQMTGRLTALTDHTLLITNNQNELTEIPIDNINSIIEMRKANKGGPVWMVAKYIAGGVLGVYGVIVVIVGVVIAFRYPVQGVAIFVAGGLLSGGAYALISSASNKFGEQPAMIPYRYTMDRVNFHLMIK